jgi:hypothetical protein
MLRWMVYFSVQIVSKSILSEMLSGDGDGYGKNGLGWKIAYLFAYGGFFLDLYIFTHL